LNALPHPLISERTILARRLFLTGHFTLDFLELIKSLRVLILVEAEIDEVAFEKLPFRLYRLMQLILDLLNNETRPVVRLCGHGVAGSGLLHQGPLCLQEDPSGVISVDGLVGGGPLGMKVGLLRTHRPEVVLIFLSPLGERFLILLRDIPQQVLLHMINALDGLELEEVSVGTVLRHEVGHGLSHLILLLIDLSRLGKFRTVQHHSIVIKVASPDLGQTQSEGRSAVVVHTLDEPAGIGEQAVVLLEEVVMALQG